MVAILFTSVLTLVACGGQMRDQPKYLPYAASTFYDDGASARPLPANTVARGELNLDSHLYAGEENGAPATTFPFPVTEEVLARGQERYTIFCAPCHGPDGYGRGIIVQRGFTPPPSFHEDRLRTAPVGYFFNVITNGFGTMYSYGDRVPP